MDFTALMTNPKVKDMLMTAGLSMLANNQSRVGQPQQTFGASLGQGLLAGTQYANKQEDQRKQDYWENWDRGVAQSIQGEKMGMAKQQLDANITNMADQSKRGWAQLDSLDSDRLYKQEADKRDYGLNAAKFGEAVRQFETETDLKKQGQAIDQTNSRTQAAKVNIDIEKEQRALKAQQRAKAVLPSFANAIRNGQAPEISGEDFAAIAEAYPKLLEQFSQAQTTLVNPETGQKLMVPVSQAIQGWKAKQGSTEEDVVGGFMGEGNAANDPVAKMVQGALSKVPPDQLEAAKVQIRKELEDKGYTPADYGL